MRDLCSSATALQDLESEFNQLQEDREILRKIIPSGNSKVRTRLNPSTKRALGSRGYWTMQGC